MGAYPASNSLCPGSLQGRGFANRSVYRDEHDGVQSVKGLANVIGRSGVFGNEWPAPRLKDVRAGDKNLVSMFFSGTEECSQQRLLPTTFLLGLGLTLCSRLLICVMRC